jgi:cold shock protein
LLDIGPKGALFQDNAEIGRMRPRDVARLRERRQLALFMERDEMATGTVKFFNTQKGFGFIQPNDGGRDVFVHISAVERSGMTTLNEGQKVSYELVTERGKTAAANLQNV